MNAMTQALQAAGVKTPSQMQRIWTALKDSYRTPGMTAVDVSKATGLGVGTVSSILNDMYKRDMVAATQQPHVRPRGPQYVLYYSAVGSTYELKPRKHTKPNPTQASALRVVAASPTLAAPYAAAKPPAHAHGVDLDKLTLGQIKALLNDIQAIFNK